MLRFRSGYSNPTAALLQERLGGYLLSLLSGALLWIVSDDASDHQDVSQNVTAGGADELVPGAKPLRFNRTRSPVERAHARFVYESTNLSLRQVGLKVGISRSTLMKWSMADKWRKPEQLVIEAAGGVEAMINKRATDLVEDKLAPFIEEHRVKITKRAVVMAERGLKRLEALWKSAVPSSTRSEADGARALETFVRTARQSLGMEDNTQKAKGLSVEMLAGGGAAIRVRQD